MKALLDKLYRNKLGKEEREFIERSAAPRPAVPTVDPTEFKFSIETIEEEFRRGRYDLPENK